MNPLDPLAKMLKEQKLAAPANETLVLTPSGPITIRAAAAMANFAIQVHCGLDRWAALDGTLHGHRPGADLIPPQELGWRTP